MIATLSLEDLTGNIYNFTPEFWIGSGSIDNNTNVLNKMYVAGGANVSDGFLQAKSISLEGVLRADTPTELETIKTAFSSACLKGGKLTLSDDTKTRYINVKFPSFTTQKEQGRLYQEVSVDFIVEFPYWQDSTENEHIEIVSGDASFTVDTTGTVDIIRPVIEVTSTDTGGLPGVTMRNRSDGAAEWTYSDAQFQTGDILAVNSILGTVKLNNSNRIENFRPANFLRLQPGENTIEYEGLAASISIKYRRVYLLNG